MLGVIVMPWYSWVFAGIGAVAVVLLLILMFWMLWDAESRER